MESAVKVLTEHHISSAPVVDGNGLLVGSIDFSDVLHHICAFALQDSNELKLTWEKFRVLYLSDVSNRNPLVRLTPETKLTEALELLFSGIHRVIIVDPENRRRVVNVLAQSDLLKFLHTHSELIPMPKQLKSVGDQKLGTQTQSGFKLQSVAPEVTAREAFQKMKLTNCRALPIVQADGKLVSQISASDLSIIFNSSPVQLELLELGALEFVKKVRQVSGGDKDLLIWVEPSTNTSGVLAKMVSENVHRVYITNNLIELRGVISITDLFQILL